MTSRLIACLLRTREPGPAPLRGGTHGCDQRHRRAASVGKMGATVGVFMDNWRVPCAWHAERGEGEREGERKIEAERGSE